MFERFTEGARGLLVGAQEQARLLEHTYIGCEHLLLAAVATEGDLASVLRSAGLTPGAVRDVVRRIVGAPGEALDKNALAAIGIDLEQVRERVEATFGPHALAASPRTRRRWLRRRCRRDPGSRHIPFTPRAKRCLERSLREALDLRHNYIGTEHIVLALTAMREGVVHEIFNELDVSAAEVRAELLRRYRLAS